MFAFYKRVSKSSGFKSEIGQSMLEKYKMLISFVEEVECTSQSINVSNVLHEKDKSSKELDFAQIAACKFPRFILLH